MGKFLYLELLEDSDMIFILFCLKFGLAVGCNGVCDVVELDMTKIRDDSSQHFCWNRPNFRKWFQRNYFHKKGVRLVRMEDEGFKLQPSGKIFNGEIFKPTTTIPIFIKMNKVSGEIRTPNVIQRNNIEFLVQNDIAIVRLTTFKKSSEPALDACKLPIGSLSCSSCNDDLTNNTSDWFTSISKCIPVEDEDQIFKMEGFKIYAISLSIRQRGKYPLYKLLTSQGKMRLMFSEKSSNWQLGFSTSKVIFAQMQSAGTCPFLFNSTSTWIEGQT